MGQSKVSERQFINSALTKNILRSLQDSFVIGNNSTQLGVKAHQKTSDNPDNTAVYHIVIIINSIMILMIIWSLMFFCCWRKYKIRLLIFKGFNKTLNKETNKNHGITNDVKDDISVRNNGSDLEKTERDKDIQKQIDERDLQFKTHYVKVRNNSA